MGSPAVSRIEFIRSIRSKLSNLLLMYTGSVKKRSEKAANNLTLKHVKHCFLCFSAPEFKQLQRFTRQALIVGHSGLKVKYDDGRPAAYLGAKFRSPRHYRYRAITVSKPRQTHGRTDRHYTINNIDLFIYKFLLRSSGSPGSPCTRCTCSWCAPSVSSSWC